MSYLFDPLDKVVSLIVSGSNWLLRLQRRDRRCEGLPRPRPPDLPALDSGCDRLAAGDSPLRVGARCLAEVEVKSSGGWVPAEA